MGQVSNGTAGSVFRGLASDEAPPDPSPPYQVEIRDMLIAEAQFAPAAVRAALPRGIEPLDDCSGAFVMGSCQNGWGLAPFTSFMLGLFVKGYDTPDGVPAFYVVASNYSGRAGAILARDYNAQTKPGHSRQWREGDAFWGEGGAQGKAMVRFGLHAPEDEGQCVVRSGVHHHLGDDGAQGQTIHSIAFTGRDYTASVLSYELLPGAPRLLRQLVPRRWIWATRTPIMALTFGVPRTARSREVADDAVRLSLLDLLSRIGHAVALVALDGRVLLINAQAREVLGGALQGGRLTAWRRQDQHRLGEALHALQPGRLSQAVALRRPDGALPILARALPVGPALAGEAAALVLFSDPKAPAPGAETSLELLGLTPAEARIAALVGRGLTAREAAQVVGVSENTARSTLRGVYGKLMIGKQSELAQIVARLEGFA